MSAIGAITGGAQQALLNAAAPPKSVATSAASRVRDSDGDFDGTKPGQVDPRDAGKGVRIDRQA
jgi:hypothetical protein